MRSPVIAFSLFAAASPIIVSAAPQSPLPVPGDGFAHPRNTEVQIPERAALPRAIHDFVPRDLDEVPGPVGILGGRAEKDALGALSSATATEPNPLGANSLSAGDPDVLAAVPAAAGVLAVLPEDNAVQEAIATHTVRPPHTTPTPRATPTGRVISVPDLTGTQSSGSTT